MILTIFGAISELERSYILERQAEGIAVAKSNGVYTNPARRGGKPRKYLDPINFENKYQLYYNGKITMNDMAKMLRLSISAISRRVVEREQIGEGYDPNVLPRMEDVSE